MKRWMLATALLACTPLAMAEVTVDMSKTTDEGTGESIGSVTFEDTDYGLLITPDLHDLPSGTLHGFHLHQNPSCAPSTSGGEVTPAGAAGGHVDPDNTGTHAGPYVKDSHLGDMPAMMVDQNGNSTTPTLAPRLEESDLAGHAVMLHEGGDNYSESPKLGGGGARLACGVIETSS